MSRPIKVKSLSLNRKSQSTPPEPKASTITEENKASLSRLEVALNSPVSCPSRHSSTPVRSNGETAIEDSLDQDPGGSPISMFPCTQDSGGEVAWDWNGAGLTTEGRTGFLSITPKRRQNVKKKRLENSPLLNLNLKRKIVNNDKVECINKFAEELQALAETIESERKNEAEKRAKVSNNDERIAEDIESFGEREEEDRDKAWADMSEMETQVVKKPEIESSDIHDVKTLRFNVDKIEAGLDDLFDDSIDASMVQCSQEIEEKMRLESSETEKKFDGRYNDDNDDNDDDKKSEIPASQIPDDSFDDCLALCMDDDHDMVSKFLEPEGPKENLTDTRTKEWAEIRTYAKRKQQSRGSDESPLAHNQQSRKFFKTKSHSDPMYPGPVLDRSTRSVLNPNVNSRPGNSSSTISRSSSNLNLSTINRIKDSVPPAGSRNDSSSSSVMSAPNNNRVSNSYLRNTGDVSSPVKKSTGIYDFYVKPVTPNDKSTRNSRGSQPSYTPAEIARKRAEAKAKLEASRLKKQNSFAKLKPGISLSAVKRPPPVKR